MVNRSRLKILRRCCKKNFMMEVMRVLIRKAELQDVRAVYALICELDEQDLPLMEFENIFGSLLKLPEHFLMIGEIEGRTVAFLHLRVEGQLHHAAKIAEILEFDVERSYRAGTRAAVFVTYAEKRPGTIYCIQLELSSNMLRKKAHCFYERQGMHKFHYKFTLPLSGKKVNENKLGV